MSINFTLNGKPVSSSAEKDVPLLYVLRNDFHLTAAKFGCGLAQCGACSVLVDDEPVRSCVVTLKSIAGKRVTTLEGLADEQGLHPLQQAFIDEQAMQCGYCSNGMIITGAALLAKNAMPNKNQIVQALDSVICRCGAHQRILKAVASAAAQSAEQT